ncbi:phenylalanyl-tRNA synthetase, alpha subunit [Methanocaldococcus vulcanius M7]|uniref:Phenylalanine--tRNA ligase alpha subunit n=1 Tax=Methanocaldococcus vulcanius (strain ATCC 700851 / DSM 12094 / M7) TaxID=579137 RepID=C9RI75_METVM|nr:phenylalanine--tRNA ligase subunit alpha [Methanocaldococcus vulcanius]ACX73277.1 phenylalanyl-tRNA synthetase, alpha subunit [Methanocaldococcus vulcanius M7]
MELHVDEKRLLKIFQDQKKEEFKLEELEKFMPKEKILRVSLWLKGKDLVESNEKIRKIVKIAKNDEFPERKIAKYLKEHNLSEIEIKNLKDILPKEEINAALGSIKRKNIAKIDKGKIIFENLDYDDVEEDFLKKIGNGLLFDNLNEEEKRIVDILKKRGFVKIDEEKEITIKLTEKGKEFIKKPIEIEEEITQLTRDTIISGKWKKAYIRPYDVKIPTKPVYPAKIHPLTRIIREVKEILLAMGFKEVKSPIVETEFWNFDMLFEPQDHPAREMQDTFFLKYPQEGEIPEDLLDNVKEVHERCWKYKFDENISKRLILRTHTTSSSIRYLASLSEEEKNKPHKVFCIDRVFRNEAIDYKHLPEFYQCEGIIMGEDVNFNNLIGVLKEFLKRLGFEKVRFRPAYFPFTEPSLEAEVYLESRGWLEILGAGIFRPEVLEPIGIKKPVLAWGIGFSRLAMLRFGLKDIRDLHKNDLDWLKRV